LREPYFTDTYRDGTVNARPLKLTLLNRRRGKPLPEVRILSSPPELYRVSPSLIVLKLLLKGSGGALNEPDFAIFPALLLTGARRRVYHVTSLTSYLMRNESSRTWQVQTAKARFSELFRLARTEGPQLITKQGKEGVVMIPVEQFEQLTGRARQPKSLVQFFRESPLVGVELDLERDRTPDAKSNYERVSAGHELRLRTDPSAARSPRGEMGGLDQRGVPLFERPDAGRNSKRSGGPAARGAANEAGDVAGGRLKNAISWPYPVRRRRRRRSMGTIDGRGETKGQASAGNRRTDGRDGAASQPDGRFAEYQRFCPDARSGAESMGILTAVSHDAH